MTALVALCFLNNLALAQVKKAPKRAEGDGPYKRLIIRGVNLINGAGSPMRGPVDIVVEKDRITNIRVVGVPGLPINPKGRPKANPGDKELNAEGMYLMPGFVDMHGHIGGTGQRVPAEYVFKLWMAHGVTTIREPGSFNALSGHLTNEKKVQKMKLLHHEL